MHQVVAAEKPSQLHCKIHKKGGLLNMKKVLWIMIRGEPDRFSGRVDIFVEEKPDFAKFAT